MNYISELVSLRLACMFVYFICGTVRIFDAVSTVHVLIGFIVFLVVNSLCIIGKAILFSIIRGNMGNDVSKEIKDIVDVLEVNEKSCMTPSNTSRCSHIDPRSPSEGITRTPLEVRKNFVETGETCMLRRRWKSEPEISPMKIDQTDNVVLCDPRSPTVGIARTPIQVPYSEKTWEQMFNDETTHENLLPKINMVVDVPDCRSPSLGICRTPIQVAAHGENKTIKNLQSVQPVVDDKLETKLLPNRDVSWHTPKRIASPSFVYTDDVVEIKGKKDMIQYNENSIHEKENDASLKRKLKFTPELVKTGVKVRTPLGSRCNFQDSPSQFLKKIQVQKVDEELENIGENASNNYGILSKSTAKTQSIVEWDNKDSTLIM